MSKKRPIKEDDDDNVSMFSDEDLLEIGKDGIGGHAAAGRNDVVAAAADKQAAVNKQRENAAVNAIKRRRIPAAASDDDDDDNTSVITEVSVTGPQIIRLADFPLIGGGGGGGGASSASSTSSHQSIASSVNTDGTIESVASSAIQVAVNNGLDALNALALVAVAEQNRHGPPETPNNPVVIARFDELFNRLEDRRPIWKIGADNAATLFFQLFTGAMNFSTLTAERFGDFIIANWDRIKSFMQTSLGIWFIRNYGVQIYNIMRTAAFGTSRFIGGPLLEYTIRGIEITAGLAGAGYIGARAYDTIAHLYIDFIELVALGRAEYATYKHRLDRELRKVLDMNARVVASIDRQTTQFEIEDAKQVQREALYQDLQAAIALGNTAVDTGLVTRLRAKLAEIGQTAGVVAAGDAAGLGAVRLLADQTGTAEQLYAQLDARGRRRRGPPAAGGGGERRGGKLYTKKRRQVQTKRRLNKKSSKSRRSRK